MKRKLGRSGIEVSALGAGCWAIGGPFWAGTTPLGWGEVDDAESMRALQKALELGITFLIPPIASPPSTTFEAREAPSG